MIYTSTRNNEVQISGTEAIIKGLSEEGGLFVPTEFPQINIEEFVDLNYQDTAKKLLSLYFPEIPTESLKDIVGNYEKKFENSEEITPITSFKNFSFLELYHGPTASFKDMALTLLPGLMRAAYDINERKERILILTATSGDTGSAALEGFQNQDRVEIAVFYPEGGVSEIQKLQMESAEGENAFVHSIVGNFDDAQRSIKEIFGDEEIQGISKANGKNLASANSINIARLISQITYYIYSYCQLLKNGVIESGDKIDIVVPTGNFGDILAGIYGKFMGVPIENAICASNSNDILTDFFNTGIYDTNRDFLKTISPSMDILISSNLERFLFWILENNPDEISKLYKDLKDKGKFVFENKFPDYIKGVSVDDEKTKETILEVFKNYNYLIDPHTAVAFSGVGLAKNHALVVSTASPYKFSNAVLEALQIDEEMELKDQIQKISEITMTNPPKSIKNIMNATIDKKSALNINEIKNKVIEILEN